MLGQANLCIVRYRNLNDIANALSLPLDGCNEPVFGFAVDTRLLEPGQVFAALPGEAHDGHQFLRQAADAKAAGALVSKGYRGENFGLSLLRVGDPLAALQALAGKAAEKSRIVGVTGSVGKTTCKEFIVELLRGKFKVALSPGNQNTKIGLPLSILNHSGFGEDFLVLEMGMSKKGEIAALTRIAPPEIALVTYVSLAHAENFDSLEEIAMAKGEIFTHPKTRLGILPEEACCKKILMETGTCEKRTFSSRLEFDSFPLKARHHKHNAQAAIEVAKACGMKCDEIGRRLPLLKMPKRRGEVVEKGGIRFVDDSYNASPDSMKAALESLPSPGPGGKRIAVLGEMLELGRFSESAHLEVGNCALDHVDRLFCFGPSYEILKNRGAVVSGNKQELIELLKSDAASGDVVLLKGSNSCKMWEIMDNFL